MSKNRANWRSASAFCVVLALGPLATMSDAGMSSDKGQETADVSNEGEEGGRALFERNCVVCHGIEGTGGRGPSLNRPTLSRAPDDAALHDLLENGIPPEMPNFGYGFFTDQEEGALIGYVRSLGQSASQQVSGDATRGEVLFARNGCPSCHIFAGSGTGLGPDLTQVNEHRSIANLRQVIMNPAANLRSDFLMVRVVTPTGSIVQGIRVNEDTYTIQIKDASGHYYSFRKPDLKELQKQPGKTPMPSFETRLTKSELEDLVAYLISPRQRS